MTRPLSTLLGLAVLTTAALVGCGATEPVDRDGPTELTFLLDGERWTANVGVQAGLTDYGFQVFSELRFDDRFPRRQHLGFSVPLGVWDGVGVYPIAGRYVGEEYYTALLKESDGDAGIASYYPVGAAAEVGGLEVTRYDEATGEVEGRFEGVFAVAPGSRDQTLRELPDTVRVTEGRFRAVLRGHRAQAP